MYAVEDWMDDQRDAEKVRWREVVKGENRGH